MTVSSPLLTRLISDRRLPTGVETTSIRSYRATVYSHHKIDHEFKGSPPPFLSFVVCSIPRSGSSLLCELLTNTGLAGAPTEFFDPLQMKLFQQAWGCPTLDAT